MDLRQLEYFLAVIEEGSFTRAAARLYMVQSSLSASLLALERELGTELFIRGRRGAGLTDAGRAFLGPARAALAEAERARDAVAEVRGLIRGSVRVATVPVPRSVDVIETIRRFHDQHPGVDVHVIHDGAQDMLRLTADGHVDFAVSPLMYPPPPGLQFELLLSTPLVIVCPADHRLAGARELDPREILDEPIIDLPRGWWIRELFDRMLRDRGVSRRAQLEVNEWFGVLTMVRRGLGITYGAQAAAEDETPAGLSFATLIGAPAYELGIASRDEALRGDAGRAFLTAYRQQHADMTGGRPFGSPPLL